MRTVNDLMLNVVKEQYKKMDIKSAINSARDRLNVCISEQYSIVSVPVPVLRQIVQYVEKDLKEKQNEKEVGV